MTSHELARLLLTLPDSPVVDDRGTLLTAASAYFAGRILRADDGTFHGYAFPPQPTDSPVVQTFFNALAKEDVVVIS